MYDGAGDDEELDDEDRSNDAIQRDTAGAKRIEGYEPWRYWILDMRPETQIAPPVSERIRARMNAAWKIILNEVEVEAQREADLRRQVELETLYDPLQEVRERGGINMLLHDLRRGWPRGSPTKLQPPP